MQFPVEQDSELLFEYRENFVEYYQRIEHLTIRLESNPYDQCAVLQLSEIFKQLWLSSAQLNLTPLVENLVMLTKIFDCYLAQGAYPRAFSEYLLILIDRLLMIIDDALHTNSIDMLKAQQMQVSLQILNACENVTAVNKHVAEAIEQITRSASDEDHPLSKDFDIVLFEETDLFTNTDTLSQDIDHVKTDAILKAREFMRTKDADPLLYLANLTDRQTKHGVAHTRFLLEICLAMNVMESEVVDPEQLWTSIVLHDIGLAHLEHILSSNRKLTEGEIAEVRKHPLIGAALCERMLHKEESSRVILEHHERVDGRGYPFGLTDQHISPGAKILAIVDSFHAMIMTRPHKVYTKSILRAVSEINACSGTHYDPYWVDVFNTCIKKFWLDKYLSKTKDRRQANDARS